MRVVPEAAGFAAPGAGPLEYFVVATLLARTSVKLAIVPVNLAALSEVWQDTWTRAESTGWIPFDRSLALQRLPLHWFGVTLDRFLFYQAIVASGEAERWNRAQLVQARAGRAITKARARAQGVDHPLATGLPWVPVLLSDERPNRRGALGVEQGHRRRRRRHQDTRTRVVLDVMTGITD